VRTDLVVKGSARPRQEGLEGPQTRPRQRPFQAEQKEPTTSLEANQERVQIMMVLPTETFMADKFPVDIMAQPVVRATKAQRLQSIGVQVFHPEGARDKFYGCIDYGIGVGFGRGYGFDEESFQKLSCI
jgi:hypothetical protein